MNNQRQIGMSLVMYAGEFQGRIPLGYRLGRKTTNMELTPRERKDFYFLGWVYWAGYLNDHTLFGCPSFNKGTAEAYWAPHLTVTSDKQSIWPPLPGNPRVTRTIHGVRPTIDWGDNGLPGTGSTPGKMTKLTQVADKAILAEVLITFPDHLTMQHNGGGKTVSYGDGSVKFLKTTNEFLGLASTLPNTWDTPANGHMDQLWKYYDEN